MEHLIHNGVLWISERTEDGMVRFYVVYKHEEDNYGSWAFDLSDADLAQVGTEFSTLENLRPYLDAISESFYHYGGSSRGSLKDEVEEFDQYNEYVMLDKLTCRDFKRILQKELTCLEAN